MIKVLVLTISLFILFFLESFFLKAFSFSLFVIFAISFWKKVGDVWYFIFLAIFSVILDTVLHTPLGTHMLVLGILLMMVGFLWIGIPRGSRFGYFPVFLFIFLYYLLILVVSSLLQDGFLPYMVLRDWIEILVKSLISLIPCIIIDRVFLSLRGGDSGSNIRLR